jgi:periplasmic protein TonB
MKLRSGKRIGQSGSELTLAVSFSLILHVLVIVAAVFLRLTSAPKKYIPPVYQVKLVGQPADLSQTLPKETAPVPPRKEPLPKKSKSIPKAKQAMLKTAKAAPKKGALPELAPQKQAAPEKTAPQAAPPKPSPGKSENVAVSTTQQDFRFGWYLALVRDKIGQNWRPPPDAKGAMARIVFAVNRSGWVGEVTIDTGHSSGTFGFQQAAIRAIRSSNPFPPLPEEFSKQSLEFSVDLMENE